MPKTSRPRPRSRCPLNASVEILGDRWSLLIIRDLMLRGVKSFKDLSQCDEGIASNILADRLRKLIMYEILAAQPDPSDGRKQLYRLTAKGIDLAPILTEMVLWAAAHEDVGNRELSQVMKQDKQKFIAGVRKRWVADGER